MKLGLFLTVACCLLVPASNARAQEFGPKQVISTKIGSPRYINAADCDQDGDEDLLVTFFNADEIMWYENLGAGQFGPGQLVTDKVVSPQGAFPADLDDDGDLDILYCAKFTHTVGWIENRGGGHFAKPRVISNIMTWVTWIHAVDLDGDDDLDVLCTATGKDELVMFENRGLGGVGYELGFSPPIVLLSQSNGVNSLDAADFDGDGDLDVLSTAEFDDEVSWLENNGSGKFIAQHILDTNLNGPEHGSAADLDGDGDQDVMVITWGVPTSEIAWYENLGAGLFSAKKQLSGIRWAGGFAYAEDLDDDGDLDVLSTSTGLGWNQNRDAGDMAPMDVIADSDEYPLSVFAVDVDGDGDKDVIATYENGDTVTWHENLMGPDCNGNGIPDAKDLASGFSYDIDGDGNLDDCVNPALVADTYEMSISQGGSQTFFLQTPDYISQTSPYLLLGSASGTTPGVSVSFTHLPLNADWYFSRTLSSPNSYPLSDSLGFMSPSPNGGGHARARFRLNPGANPNLVGLTMHHAFVNINALTGVGEFVSNAVPVILHP